MGVGVRSAGVALLVTCVASCAPQPTKRKRKATFESTRPVVTVRGLEEPAQRYGETIPPKESGRPIERSVLNLVQSIAATSRYGAPQLDEGLSRAAKVIVRGVHRFEQLPPELQAYARAQSGTFEPIVQFAYNDAHHRFFERGDYGVLRDQIVNALAREEVTHFGVGVHEDLGGIVRILAVFSRRRIRIDPFPTYLPPQGRHTIGFELPDGFHDPALYVQLPNGFVVQREVKADGMKRFVYELVCPETPGIHQVEIFGSDERGPRVLVNAPISCGGPHPREFSYELPGQAPPVPTVAEAEAALLLRLNAERTQRSLRPVELDTVLAEVARGHSTDMAENGFFAHVSPRTGTVFDRAKAAGVVAQRVGENIALNSRVDGLHIGLMGSPGHRMLILDPDMDRVGVGVVIHAEEGHTKMWATEVFSQELVEPPEPIEVAEEPAPTPAKEPVAGGQKPGTPVVNGIRIVAERPGFMECASIGIQMEEAPGTGPAVLSGMRSKLIAEAKLRKANTLYVEDRSTQAVTSLLADFYRCP